MYAFVAFDFWQAVRSRGVGGWRFSWVNWVVVCLCCIFGYLCRGG